MCPLMLIRAPVVSTEPAGSLYCPALCVINWSHYRNWESLANCLSVIDHQVAAATVPQNDFRLLCDACWWMERLQFSSFHFAFAFVWAVGMGMNRWILGQLNLCLWMTQVHTGTADVPILVEHSADTKEDFLGEVEETDVIILEESQTESPNLGSTIAPTDDSMFHFFSFVGTLSLSLSHSLNVTLLPRFLASSRYRGGRLDTWRLFVVSHSRRCTARGAPC